MYKISVIIPVYNTEKYLKKCLDSVLNNTLKDIEIICVDDGSTDNSLKILEEYAQKYSNISILHSNRLGGGGARNKGLEVATGEYLYFLDSDDFIDENLFEKVYKKCIENSAEIGVFNYNILDEMTGEIKVNTNFLNEFENKNILILIKQYQNTFFDFFIVAPFIKLYSRDFVNKNKLKFQPLKSCNDVYFNYASLIKADRVVCLDEALVTSRRNRKGSITSSRGKYSENILISMDSIKKLLIKNNLFNLTKKSFYKKCYKHCLFELGVCAEEKRKDFVYKLMKFLPLNYKLKLLYREYFKNVFEITNQKTENGEKNKIIIFMGKKFIIK